MLAKLIGKKKLICYDDASVANANATQSTDHDGSKNTGNRAIPSLPTTLVSHQSTLNDKRFVHNEHAQTRRKKLLTSVIAVNFECITIAEISSTNLTMDKRWWKCKRWIYVNWQERSCMTALSEMKDERLICFGNFHLCPFLEKNIDVQTISCCFFFHKI